MTDLVETTPRSGADRIRRLVSAAIVAAILPIGATAQTFMSEEELLATIPGSMINSKTKEGQPWAQSYSAYRGGKKTGAIRGVLAKTEYDATWFVQNGQWCENWGDGEACWQVERVDDKSLRMYLDGKPRKHLWKLN